MRHGREVMSYFPGFDGFATGGFMMFYAASLLLIFGRFWILDDFRVRPCLRAL